MIQHFRQRNPTYEQTHRIPFDLLCLLQHYQLPTRLLDWTESILTALYFAVENENHDKSDGQLFALNARRLNSVTRLHDKDEGYICGSNSVDVAVRSAMASARRVKDLKYVVQPTLDAIEEINTGNRKYKDSGIHALKLWLSGDLRSGPPGNTTLVEQLTSPVAVFPNRLNPRMTSQLSMVLIFGGKKGRPSVELDSGEEARLSSLLNDVLDPEELNRRTPDHFLMRFCIPFGAKSILREQLRHIGMHEAALFPELDHIGNYVRKEWTFPRKTDG